jgi:hypothetical protein
MQFSLTSCHSPLFSSNISPPPCSLFSNTLHLCSSTINVRDHRQNYSFIFSNFYVFRQHTILDWLVASPTFNFISTSPWIKFWFVTVVPSSVNCATLLKDLLGIFMSWFCLAFWWEESNIHLVFLEFPSRPTSLLASKFLCFSSWYLTYLQAASYHQHGLTADLSHLISIPPGFPGPY